MNDHLKDLETAVGAMLAKEQYPTPERIRELIRQFRVIETLSIDDTTAERLARDFETRHGVTMTLGAMLVSRDYEPWLEGARSRIDPYYWDRYKKLLNEKQFSIQVIETLDNVTDRILGLLENPSKDGPWDRRGMVFGHVQSGKTANYTGLICKAADSGYKLIVVIAGIHNKLRNQTQLRIDEGFVGRDSARLLLNRDDKFVGVGRFDQSRRPGTFTTSVKDFNKIMATGIGMPLQNLNEPAVFVIKKNTKTLENLLEWLGEHSASRGGRTVNAPMLLIDDEADNASINIKYGKTGVARINGQIRELLCMFERSCYIGYTATPFANIFIDPDSDDEMLGQDLFPRNFIVSLDPPTNYFGPTKVFLDDSEAIVRHINDNEDILPIKHTIDLDVVDLPQSLIRAMRTFVVARAIRLARGHITAHCSMLVNVSRFTDVQRKIHSEISNKLREIQASVRLSGALPPDQALKYPEISALHAVWQDEFSDTGFDWPRIQNLLHDAAAPIKVVEVNSRAAGTLNYKDYERTGLNIIAVGGYSLSRGLTLEGLIVSYFLRNSMMYDTLMQMGRWFGYRPDYEDLCRVWIPEKAESWYAHISESVEELREELRKMEEANATPEEFGLKIRSHPDTLIVTARNKMGSGERVVVNIGLGNSFVETTILKRDQDSLYANRFLVRRLVAQLSKSGKPISSAEPISGGWLIRDAPVGPVMDFVSQFRNHSLSMLTAPGPVRRYIEARCDSELATWDILFASLSEPDYTPIVDESLGIKIICQRRRQGESDTKTLRISDNQRVASRGIEKTGLNLEVIKKAEEEYRNNSNYRTGSSYPDRIYRPFRERPLLIVHLLAIGEKGMDLSQQNPVVAWSISFPETNTPENRVEYIVNTTWLRENFGDDIAEDEMEGDND